MFENLLIWKRLALGFGIVMCFTLAIGVVSLINTAKLDDVTHELYEEPFKSNNALRDIGRRIYAMQSALKDIAISQQGYRVQDAVSQLRLHDIEIMKDLYLIKKVPGADQERIARFVEQYSVWKEIQAEIIRNKKLNNQERVVELTEERSEESVLLLESFIDEFIVDANALGEKFIHEAEMTHDLTNKEMFGLLLFTFMLGLFISFYIARGITRPLDQVVKSLKKLSVGDLEHEINIYRGDELGIVADSYREMIENLRHKAAIADYIKEGDLDHLVEVQSKSDQLALSMNEMIQSLRTKTQENENQHWFMAGVTELALAMRGDQEVQELTQNVINFLANYLDCSVGIFFISNEETSRLDYISGYAYFESASNVKSVAYGESLVGQAAEEKKLISLYEIPENYIKISSSLGEVSPSHLIVLPITLNEKNIGVLELASLHLLTPLEIEFLESVSENIAIAINSAQSRVRMRELLDESHRQAALLLSQQEELKASNDALEEKTKRLIASEESLKVQQEELQSTNEELEEQTASLKASESRLQVQQEELQAANEELELKTESLQAKNAEIEQFSRDINEKALALEKASKYKSEFLANMSHELRTPLNSLLLLARTLAEDSTNLTDDQIEAATIIYNSGNDLLNLINDILDLSKIEAGQMSLDISEIRLDDIVSRLRKTFEHVARNKGLVFTVNFANNLPEFMHGDLKRIDQILKNLISNAIKFTHHGEISIDAVFSKAGDDRDMITISVSDTGIGIPKDKQEIIFEAFQQAEGGTARQYGGTGLGLSISRQLVTLMEGEISLSSEPNKGTTFSVSIPVNLSVDSSSEKSGIEKVVMSQPVLNPSIVTKVPEKQVIAHQEELLQAQPIEDDRDRLTDQDKVILIIEDDLNFAKILLQQSRQKNFKAIVTDNGEAGYLLANKYLPSAIILDLTLPGMDGFKLLDQLKENPDTRHIPVHIISAMDSEADVFNKGAIGFLQKPVNKEKLVDTFSYVADVIEKEVKDLLLVEDDENVQLAIAKLIGNGDVKITKAVTGEAAFKAIESGHFDCMILDLGLPDMSGFELLTRLHANRTITIPPVIVYTARDLTREETDKLREFSQSIIIKGVRSEERLLDETALFLHRVIGNLPEQKQAIIRNLYDKDAFLINKKVLIVDDDMRNLFALSKILRDRGMQIIKAQNGRKALEMLAKEEDVSLVLMDIMMPEMDGYETTKAIRNQREYANLPIIALTAKAMKEDREKCIAAGASDYLSKPIDIDRLLSMLRVWLYQ